jgi:hypothetical protein
MKDAAVTRWMGFLGLATVVALFLGFGPLGGGAPGENASGVSVAHWYNTHVNQSWGSVYVVALGLVLVMVFVTQLRTVLRTAGGGQLWPNLAFASGIILVTGIVVLGCFQTTLILASHNHEYAVVKFANFFGENNEILFLFGVGLLTLSTGLAILLNRAVTPLPKTLGWYSVLVGVICAAGPLSFFAFLFGFPIWLIATGFVVATKQRRGTLGSSSSDVAAAASLSSASQLVTTT